MKYTLCILLLIGGCKPETTSEHTATVAEDSTASAPGVFEPIEQTNKPDAGVIAGTYQIENDEIGGYPFEQDFDAMVKSLQKLDITRQPVRNVHDSTKTDTLVRVNFGPSAIEYYKIQADGSGFILEANIRSNEVTFKKGIRIGMSLNEFVLLFEELKGKENLETVIISTMEGLNQAVFSFDNDKLSSVRYESYFD